jgi:ubiquinone/menaquinone biosynthesis C-methylase UbiE/broad specificity phosphatase PhoE
VLNVKPGVMKLHPQSSPDAPDGGEAVEARLLLICQSEGLRNRYAGLAGFTESDDNAGLTAVGWEQTNLLAAWLKSHEKIDVLISGPQLRSRLTAQRIGQMLGLPVKVRSDLPKNPAERRRTPGSSGEMPRALAQMREANRAEDVAAVGDTDYHKFLDSVVAAVDQVMAENWGKSVAFVLNGGAITALIRQFFGAQTLPIDILHTGISEFRRQGGVWRLVYVNRREHLPVPPLPATSVQGNASTGAAALDVEELAGIVDIYNRTASHAPSEQPTSERIQRMRDFLRFGRLPADVRMLDVGSGGGTLALLMAEEGAREVVGVDVSPVMLEAAEFQRLSRTADSAAHVSFRLAPAQALPFSDEWFDVVVCRLVLHHTSKPERMLVELTRVLKPGGILLFADLLGPDDAVKRATQNAIEERRNPAYVAARTAEQYRKLLAGAGLEIDAEKVAVFERELDEWLTDMDVDAVCRTTVRDMMEAGLETDASGQHARRQGMKLLFEQRMFYARTMKPKP